MFIARRRNGAAAGNTVFAGHNALARATIRRRGTLRVAVTATATGLTLAVPLTSQAMARINPAVLKSLHLDSATLKKVKSYDRYRTREAGQRTRAKRAISFARKQIGKPYLWGADGPARYDCSGLAMAAWRKAGVALPRVTYGQYRKVKRKVSLGNLKPGDLVFFNGRSHVGMYVGNGRFLHAPHTGARVRVDRLGARRKARFAGAVRPGAPRHRQWSPSVRELVEKIERMSAQKRADQKPPDNQRSPHIPPPTDALPKPSDTPANKAPDPGPDRTSDSRPGQASESGSDRASDSGPGRASDSGAGQAHGQPPGRTPDRSAAPRNDAPLTGTRHEPEQRDEAEEADEADQAAPERPRPSRGDAGLRPRLVDHVGTTDMSPPPGDTSD